MFVKVPNILQPVNRKCLSYSIPPASKLDTGGGNWSINILPGLPDYRVCQKLKRSIPKMDKKRVNLTTGCFVCFLLFMVNIVGTAAFLVEPNSNEDLSLESIEDRLESGKHGYENEQLINKRDFEVPEYEYEHLSPHGSSNAESFAEVLKRYVRPSRGWGHRSRYPWKRLPDRLCFQQKCKKDKDCCMRHNICDRSAKVCRDCWYGSVCKSEEHCCHAYPYCLRTYRPNPYRKGHYIAEGKCVDTLSRLRTFGAK